MSRLSGKNDNRPHSRGDMLASGTAGGDEGDAVILSEFYLRNFRFQKKKGQ